jgi:hypothetical protein
LLWSGLWLHASTRIYSLGGKMSIRTRSVKSLLWVVLGYGFLQSAVIADESDKGAAGYSAILVPGSGQYSRQVDSLLPAAQPFFDQGLRLA